MLDLLRGRTGLAALVAAAGLCLATAGPVAAQSVTVLDLELNEPAGSHTAVDTSASAHPGTIGSHLVMNGAYATFDVHSPSEGIAYHDDHLILVPDAADGSLDPGAGRFSVEVRFRYVSPGGGANETPNLLQKGQWNSPGGQVKLQFVQGRLSCTIRTPHGSATAISAASVVDGAWHVVRCERTPTSVTVFVDGLRSGSRTASTGTLDNAKPWALGGKEQCDARQVDCDYFAGSVDYVRLTKG